MKQRIVIYCFTLFVLFIKANAQINLIPNGSFDFGGDCNCITYNSGEFNASDWESTSPGSSDWLILPLCQSSYNQFMNEGALPKLFSHSIVGIGSWHSSWQEGVRVQLKENLKAGKNYEFRIKIGLPFNTYDNDAAKLELLIGFAKWNQYWGATSNPSILRIFGIGNFILMFTISMFLNQSGESMQMT